MNEPYSTVVRVCNRWWPARWQQRLPIHRPRLMYRDALWPDFVCDCVVTSSLRSWLEHLEWDRLLVIANVVTGHHTHEVYSWENWKLESV